MKRYEIKKSDKIFTGRILDIVHETLILPDGREALREIVVRGPAAAIVAVDHDGGIFFVRQYRAPLHDEILELPAGMMNEGEEPIDCAKRELTEETGMIAGKTTQILELCTTVGFCTERIHIFLAEDLRPGVAQPDDDEFISIEKYSLDDAVAKIFSGEIKDSKTIVGLLAYKNMK